MKKYLIACSFLIASSCFAAVLGDFSSSRILPGHIDLNENSPFYKGILNSSKNDDELERRSPSQIMKSYFEGNKFSLDKFKLLENQVSAHEQAFKKYTCIEEFRNKIDSYDDCDGKYLKKKKFQEEWNKSRYSMAFDLLNQHIARVKSIGTRINVKNINNIENIDFLESFFTIIELYYGMTQSDPQKGGRVMWEKALITAQGMLTSSNKVKNHDIHASNLINIYDQTKSFFSYEELEKLKESGEDLSKLEPYNSGVWRKPKDSIKNYVMTNYNNDGVKQLEEYFPKEKVNDLLDRDKIIYLTFDGDTLKGGNTPKFVVKYAGTKFKLKFITSRQHGQKRDNIASSALRNLWGSEVNVEPAANHLAAAMGYTVDPTYYKKQVRLYVDEDKFKMSTEAVMDDLIKRLNDKYMVETNVKSAFSDLRVDENGRKYYLLKSITLESKTNEKTDMNVGFFRHTALGKTLKREHRALYLFLSWIADPDMTDDNTKVKIVPVINESGKRNFKVVLSNSDMGGSLGIGYPNIFNFNLVKKIKTKKGKLTQMELRYMRLFEYKMKHAINIDDAKWITRRIAQLSLEQITNAFRYAGFPEVVAKYYALLLAKKRNQLVDVLGLNGESFKDDGGEDFTIEKLEEFTGSIKGYEEYFRNSHLTDPENKLFNPEIESFPRYWGVSWRNRDTEKPQGEVLKEVGAWILKELTNSAQNALSSRLHIGRKGIRLANRSLFNEAQLFRRGNKFIEGLDAGVLGIIPVRTIVANPDPEASKPFLVVDILRFGVYAAEEEDFLSSLGFSIRDFAYNSVRGTKLYYLKEVIKTTPVDDISAYFSTPLNPFKIQHNDWKTFVRDDFKQAKAGENYIVSHYVGIDSGLRLRPHFAPITSVTVGAGISLAKRAMLFGGEELSVRLSRERNYQFNAAINLFDFILQFPLASLEINKRKFFDQVYKFNKEEDLNQLMDCVDTKFTNEGCSANETHIATRQTKVSEMTTFWGIRWLFEKHSNRRYIFRDLENFQDNTKTGEKLYQYSKSEMDWIKLDWGEESIVSSMYANKSGDIELLINYMFTDSMMERETLREVVKRNDTLFPEDIVNTVLNDPIKHFMGNSEVMVDIVFSKESLDRLFSQKLIDFCESYSKFRKKEHKCTETSAPKYIFKIWKKIQRLKPAYNSIGYNMVNWEGYKNLKEISKFFYDHNYKRKIVGYLVSISKKSEFKRDVHIWSHVNPFPNDVQEINEIKESDLNKDKYKSKINNETEIMGDHLVDALRGCFFSYL